MDVCRADLRPKLYRNCINDSPPLTELSATRKLIRLVKNNPQLSSRSKHASLMASRPERGTDDEISLLRN